MHLIGLLRLILAARGDPRGWLPVLDWLAEQIKQENARHGRQQRGRRSRYGFMRMPR